MQFQTPGVYIQEVEVALPPRVRMDIAGWVGQAQRGPLNVPQPIATWGQFRDIFGDFVGFGYLPYAVFGFFLNGGERCYVVRVAHETATRAARKLVDTANEPAIRVEAINEGAWGNAVEVTVGEQSTGDVLLTQLDAELKQGQNTATMQSVGALAKGDTVMFLHRDDPVREDRRIQDVDVAARSVLLDSAVAHTFPSGSGVMGKGFTLTVRYQSTQEVFDNLVMDEGHERYFVRVINGDPEEPDYVRRAREGLSVLVRVTDLTKRTVQAAARPRGVTARNLTNGDDGPRMLPASYYTGYNNGAYFRPLPPNADVVRLKETAAKLFGLATLEAVDDIGLIAIPDLILADWGKYYGDTGAQMPNQGIIFSQLPFDGLDLENLKIGQRDMLSHCETMGERFAILDAPRGLTPAGKGMNRIEDWPSHFQPAANTKYGALYYPWIREQVADFDGRDLLIPPSGHVAGIYARTEQASGVGKAPANEIVRGIVALEFEVGNAAQDRLNPKGVNCLRVFPGRGLRVWGPRTLSREPLWRYVNVRRIGLSVIKHLFVNLQWTVFEPNDQRLWDAMVAALRPFFGDLFASGALAGATPDQAFFVKCDAQTNLPDAIDRGEVVAQVGFAPVRPAEFVLVTIKRTAATLSVREQGA
jgi:phage tail sheath protein FI